MNEILFDPNKGTDKQSKVSFRATDDSFGEILAELGVDETSEVSLIDSLKEPDFTVKLSPSFYAGVNKSITEAFKAEGLG